MAPALMSGLSGALSTLLAGYLSTNTPAVPGQLSGPLVNTTSGLVRGFYPHYSVRAFLGIPYAKPPLGSLRFRPPQPITTFPSQEIDATTFGHSCVQVVTDTIYGDLLASTTGDSEDCLSVNIWTPATLSTTLLPVFVWVYGGSFLEGASSIPMYTGLEMVKAQQDILVVTFNYRLNLFGFANSPALPEKNAGMRDQRFVLEWLRNNIAGFGGDPARMTLAGESAGAVAVSLYAYTYIDDPIVQGLIMQSGQAPSMADDDGDTWTQAANKTGCLVPQNESSVQFPTVDNMTRFGRKTYDERGAAKKFARIPALMGTNNEEGNGLVEFTPKGIVNATIAVQTTVEVFNCPTASQATYWANANVPVWRYLYKGDFPSLAPFEWAKAFHAAEIPLVFGSTKGVQFKSPLPFERTAARYLQNAWVAFVKDPHNGLKRLGWPTYDQNAATLVELFPGNSTNATFTNPEFNDRNCSIPGTLYGDA